MVQLEELTHAYIHKELRLKTNYLAFIMIEMNNR